MKTRSFLPRMMASTAGNFGSSPDGPINVNDTLYFFAYEPVHGYELWKTDGTEAGTVLAVDINPDGDASPFSYPEISDDRLFMSIRAGDLGYELWAMRVEDNQSKLYLPIEIKQFPSVP